MLMFCPDCGGNRMHYTGCSFADNEENLMRSNYQEIILNLQSEIDAYKVALKYFIDVGGKPARDIANNLLKEVGGYRG